MKRSQRIVTLELVQCQENGLIGANVPSLVAVEPEPKSGNASTREMPKGIHVMLTSPRPKPVMTSLAQCGLSGRNGHLARLLVEVEQERRQESAFYPKVSNWDVKGTRK